MHLSARIRSALFVSLALVLAGCATAYDTVDLDRTTKGYHIYCNGLPYLTVNDCYDRASYICGDDGYTVLKDNDTTASHTQSFWDQSTHTILVKCNSTASAMQRLPE
jgi:hypothetical protein